MIWVLAAVSAPLEPLVTLWPLFVLLFIFLGVAIWLTKRNENKFLQQARKIIEENDDLSYDDIHNISQSWNIERERLLRCVQALPAHERAAVSLRYFEGHGVNDIARITGSAVGTITKQLSRAIQRLREQLTRNNESWKPKTTNKLLVR